MNFKNASYVHVAMFGSPADLIEKLGKERGALNKIIDQLDSDGMSLLEKAIAYHNFSIANFLLEHNAKVNVVSNEGYNELHYIASHFNIEGAVQIARCLLDKGVSLSAQDSIYHNTALLTLCIEGTRYRNRTPEVVSFLVDCIRKGEGLYEKNRIDLNAEQFVLNKGTPEMKAALPQRGCEDT